MKRYLALLFTCVLFFTACGSADSGGSSSQSSETYDLRVSTNLAASSTIGKALEYFVEQINEQSEGRIQAVANFGSELGSQSEQVAMAMAGDLDMVVAAPGTGPGAHGGLEPLMMFEFPFLFEDNEHYRRVLKEVEPDVNELVSKIGLTAMGGQSQGPRSMLTVSPVNSLTDMEDLVMRGPNAVYIAMFEALGAVGMTMDWNDIYTALTQNVVEGVEGSPSSLNASKFQDNAKYLAVTDHIIACTYYFYNTEWYEALPSDLQDLVRKVTEEATAYQEEIDDEDQIDALQIMKDEGVTITEMSDIEEWKAACAPMLDEYRLKGENWNEFIDKLIAVE
jgi:TRAP-type C4-dicarboxylate transport system, periplasmic component